MKEKYDALHLNPKEFVKVDIGDVKLDAWMIKPETFDPSKKYPILFYVYREPAGSTVQDDWEGGALWDHFMANQGYVVMSIDNRGTKTPRGKAWRNSIYGQIGILASQDQAKAARKIFSTYSFIDTARVGIWGWSGGGQMTLNCMFRHPDIYKTSLAVAFVSDQNLYDATYQERYMGLLTDNAKGYHDGSPINYSQNLKGTLMIIAGTANDNVHYQSFEMLTNKLIKENKMFYILKYIIICYKTTDYPIPSLFSCIYQSRQKTFKPVVRIEGGDIGKTVELILCKIIVKQKPGSLKTGNWNNYIIPSITLKV